MVGSVQIHNQRESVALDMKAYSHLSAEERIRVDELRNREGLGVRPCRIRHPQGHPRARAHRPDPGQRNGILLPPARGRSAGHARLSRGPLLLIPARVEREPQRTYPPLPAQEDQSRQPHGRGPAGHRPGDQRHPMKVPDWETPNEAWYRELGKVMSKTSHPQTNVALTNR